MNDSYWRDFTLQLRSWNSDVSRFSVQTFFKSCFCIEDHGLLVENPFVRWKWRRVCYALWDELEIMSVDIDIIIRVIHVILFRILNYIG